VDYTDADDGCFWIEFSDFLKFFYITTVCYYRDDFIDSVICDEPKLGGFGLVSFTVKEDISKPMVFTIDQVNSRHVDETMRG
jgi:hypothetical protein